MVVIGGGLIGCETGLHLAQQGRNVTIVKGRSIATLPDDMPWSNALELMKLLDDNKVKILDTTQVLRLTETGLDVANQQGEQVSLVADTLVIARGMKSTNGDLVETLRDKVSEVYPIGDYVKPRIVLNAIWEGYRTARLI